MNYYLEIKKKSLKSTSTYNEKSRESTCYPNYLENWNLVKFVREKVGGTENLSTWSMIGL
jgi:hypothetical protein